MSAVAGVWQFDNGGAAEAACARALTALHPFGPHDERLWSGGDIALGRRLHRLLPEDAHDRQPLQSRDGRLTLVADLRLDNRDELVAALGLTQDEARALCDAAILLPCLERWGESAVDRVVGPFAFALWNGAEHTLTLARDFHGERPLFFHRASRFFAFASMPQGLHALPDIPYAPDEDIVAEFLALMPQRGTRTYFKGIEQVEPGHITTVTRDRVTHRRYWSPRPSSSAPRADYVEGLRFHLDQATRSHLRGAGGIVGAQLSAGFDSGAVTATAARLLAPERGKVVAFTSVPREGYAGRDPRNRFGDEGPLAAATAAMHPNIEHVLVRPGDGTPLDALDRNYFLFGAPAMNLCNGVWFNAINGAARERKLKVMLTGQMGNMTISYAGLELLPELMRRGHLVKWWRAASQQVAHAGMRWRGVAAKTFGPFMPAWLWTRLNDTFVGSSWDPGHYSALSSERMAELDLAAMARERDLDFSYRPWHDGFAMRLWVMRRGSGPGAFHKGTLAGWGLDVRDPTADKRLVEYCLSVPTEEYLKDGVQRSLAKRALADRLPAAVLNERRKGYQAIDWHERLTAARDEIAAEIDRLADCAPAARALDLPRLKRLVENWPRDGWERPEVMQAYRLALLRGISAGHFLRKASGAN